MPLRKYASLEQAEVLSLKGSQDRARTASLEKIGEFEDYRTEDGYLYARIRAISSRVNKNHDGWPSVELAGGKDTFDKYAKAGGRPEDPKFTVHAHEYPEQRYGFATFLGKPVFVDHNNSNPDRARGVIVDAKLHVEDHHTSAHDPYYSSSSVDPEHLPPTWVELLLEVDAKSFPKLAKAIVEGAKDSSKGIDGFSMGCDVERSVCNICKNSATSPEDYCKHVKLKGAEFDAIDNHGRKTSKKSYENCYGIKFFEISAVFDPADETALIREVKAGISKEANIRHSNWMMQLAALTGGASLAAWMPQIKAWMNQGKSPQEAAQAINGEGGSIGDYQMQPTHTLSLPQGYEPRQGKKHHMDGVNDKEDRQYQHIKEQYMADGKSEEEAAEIAARTVNKQKGSSIHTAENPLPQSDMMTTPEYVDTLRKEEVCPVCGSSMEQEHQCDVCGYVAPPDGLDNPDLEKAHQRDLQTDPQEEAFNAEPIDTETHPSVPEASQPNAEPSIPPTTARVTGDMAWQIYHPRLAGRINPVERPIKANPRPATNEPTETVISDQDRPVTQRTAADMIAATQRTQDMAQRTAADAPTADTKADKRVDVTGVGGVDHATNEEASKPRGPHSWESEGTTTDVEGKGGILQDSNEEAAKAQRREDLPTAGRDSDDSGFNKDKTTQDSGKTRTFDNSNEPGSAVTDKAFSHVHDAAKQGVKPLKVPEPFSVDPQARVNVESDEFFNNPGTDTDQWTGTGGNGVTKQQNPVTPKVGPGNDVRRSSFIDILKIADAEVEMGILSPEEKYDRLAELENESDDAIEATAKVLSRVRTAGLKKNAATKQGGVGRMPSFRAPRQASTNSDTPDESLFW